MPLEKGKSKAAFEHNVKAEMHSGKPMKQSLAIAYAMKRKKAKGGMIEHEEKASGYEKMPMAQKYAKGGMIHDDELSSGYLAMPKEHEKHNAPAEHEDEKDINEHLGHSKDDPESSPHMAHGGDIVSRIMEARHPKPKKMAEGGLAADEGEADYHELADHDPNDFDYLSVSDRDDHTENSGASDGDELGDAQEDHDREDIIKRIMKQRSMKQHNPKPA